jgi:outer membrane lipoprotein carrier protein
MIKNDAGEGFSLPSKAFLKTINITAGNPMRTLSIAAACCLIFLSLAAPSFCREPAEDAGLSAAEIVDRLESRYMGADIIADFQQESTLTAMDITDTAAGRVWFKHPGMMRWEYQMPDSHAIITDGDRLWIYRPEDNQVIVGDAAAYFGDGRGASFLSDISLVKEAFSVTLLPEEEPGFHRLELIPHEESLDLARIVLVVDREDFLVRRVLTENAYEDVTKIRFENIRFPETIPLERFHFDIPAGADIMQLEQ